MLISSSQKAILQEHINLEVGMCDKVHGQLRHSAPGGQIEARARPELPSRESLLCDWRLAVDRRRSTR